MTPASRYPAVDAVLAQLASLVPGEICSYGRLAERAGLPGRARLVARVLADLPAESGLPWHRVLRSGGRIAFAPGSPDFVRQAALLRAEGWQVLESGLVRGKSAASLDAELWGPG